MKGYKGFNPGLVCRGKKYKVRKACVIQVKKEQKNEGDIIYA